VTARLAAVAVLLLAAGCVDRSSAPPGVTPPPQPLQPAITLGNSEQTVALPGGMTDFNFARTRDLWVRVQVPTLPAAPAQLRLHFTSARGEPFFESVFVFSTDPTVHSAPVPGMMGDTTVMTATQVTGGWQLECAVPIGGTLFQRNPSTGQWTLDATLDGNSPLSTHFTVRMTD
jgi:hypothetical protein